MAASTYIRPRGRGAPFACSVSVSTGGSNWVNGNVSFLIAAWYSRSEHDFTTFVPLNWVWRYDGAALVDVAIAESGLFNVAAATGSSFAFSWSRPNGRQADHYSIYWHQQTTFTTDVLANKVLPTTGLVNGNIPGNATSVLIQNGTARYQALTVPVVATHAAGIYVPGNRAMAFPPLLPVTLTGVTGIANGAYNSLGAAVEWTADGPVTKVTLDGVTGVTPATQTGTALYSSGYLGLGTLGSGGYRPRCQISLEDSAGLSGAPPVGRGFDGKLYPSEFLNGAPYRRLEFVLNYGGLYSSSSTNAPSAEPGALGRLNSWAAAGCELEVVDTEDWAASGAPSPSITRYFGSLDLPGHPGTTRRWGDRHSLGFEIDGIKRSDDDRGFFAIQALSTGAGGYFDIDGDETELFVAGLGFYIIGSTNNDKSWCVASSSYNSSTNRTRIVVTGTVGATVDGRIEVQDW